MLCSKYYENSGNLQIEGYIRDNYLSCNRLGHITGYGDFKISEISALNDPFPVKILKESKKKVKEDVKMEDTKEIIIQKYNKEKADDDRVENEVNPFGAEQTWPTKEELTKKDKLVHDEYKDIDMNEEPGEMPNELETDFKKPENKEGIDKLASQFEKMEIQVLDKGNQSIDEIEDSLDDEDFNLEEYDSQLNKTSLKHEKFTNLEQREKDEMDFPDEVDTPINIPAKEYFQQYRSVNNIRTCDWDAFETLPAEYAKIWRFQNFSQVKKLAIIQTEQEGLPIDGTYVRITLEPCDEKSKNSVELLKMANESQNLIFSTMMPHERKIIISHFKIKRTEEDRNVIPSKAVLEFHVGFRRFITKPIFSDDYLHTNKSKFYRYLPHDNKVMASAFMPVCFPNSQVIVFRKGEGKSEEIEMDYDTQEPVLIAHGTVVDPDPLKIILKRIVITGYPIKCKRKRAIIRYMFFNKHDIRYFRPVELYTKHGLRGKIKDSLGTHGLMK